MPASKEKRLSRKNAHRRCEIVTGKKVVGTDYPGGESRESWRVFLENDETLIATRRKTPLRANLEIKILSALGKYDAPSPKLVATTDWKLFFQEDIKGKRLSESIMFADATTAEALLDSSLKSLSLLQLAASKDSLDLQVPLLGANRKWIIELLERPYPLAEFFNEPKPELNIGALYQLLRVNKPRFIKWDARPGNAMVRHDGTVVWFDWEHAGSRNRLDDMAWLLADEFVPDYPEVEERLIDKYLKSFADDKSIEEAKTYLKVYGTFHMFIRLGLILTYKTKGDEKWWNINHCIEKDKIGITLECAERTCSRAARWAEHSELTQPLVPLLKAVLPKLRDL